mmetsp:Transcript_93358/g.302173  ORF Transcript_93358/g.302173 Transcript_93358/m.302173 type:complete len:215 (+) Transcript_93358:73-717(+)
MRRDAPRLPISTAAACGAASWESSTCAFAGPMSPMSPKTPASPCPGSPSKPRRQPKQELSALPSQSSPKKGGLLRTPPRCVGTGCASPSARAVTFVHLSPTATEAAKDAEETASPTPSPVEQALGWLAAAVAAVALVAAVPAEPAQARGFGGMARAAKAISVGQKVVRVSTKLVVVANLEHEVQGRAHLRDVSGKADRSSSAAPDVEAGQAAHQ